MDINFIKSLVEQKESHTLEFKKSTAQLKSAFETLCAFLNEQGGTVLIGVSDSGQLVGQDVTDDTRQEIAREINKLEPFSHIGIDYIAIGNGKQIIALQAPGSPYTPHVYDDRLEIWNYGLLPPGLSVNDLKGKHESHPRNKWIAEMFYNRGFIEKWGTGTTKMIHICKASNIPAPEFEEYSGGLSVTFIFKEPIGTTAREKGEFAHLSSKQQEIIQILVNEGDSSHSYIMAKLKEPIPERALRHNLSALKNLGIIGAHGRTKATRWFMVNRYKKN